MDKYKLGKYGFNKRMTHIIGVLAVIAMVTISGGAFKQASYTITNPVEATITITGDLDTDTAIIADEILTVHATVDDRLHEKYLNLIVVPVVRLISSTGTIAVSQNFLIDGSTPSINAILGVASVSEGTYTVQLVLDITNTGELSDEIAGIIIDHPVQPVTAALSISGSNPRTGIITIEVIPTNAPADWTSRIIVKNSAGTEISSRWADLSVSGNQIESFDTTAYANGDYIVIGEIYELAGGGDQILVADVSETITTANEIPPANELIANIYVKTESGEYSSWPVAKDGLGILFGTVLVEGIVTGDTPTSVYFVVELNGQELNRFVMSMTATGNYAVEFDTTTLADGNYDMLVEANFADGTSIKMSAWGFGVVPGGGDAGISNFIIAGVIGLAVVIFVYGFKKREMLYT